jgi:light-regulated signal transduction histidine kinase (bacteriophytochrome)
MSHELRTPMNAIIGYSEMLLEEAEDTGEKWMESDLQKILSSAKHLLQLINDILDLSKIEAGRMTVFLEPVDVAQTANDVAATLEPLVAKNANTFELKCPPDAVSMRTDLTKLRQTLFNLLSNACKFTENGKVTLEITRRADHMVSFAVTDSGIGMTPEQQGKLFGEFVQAEPRAQISGMRAESVEPEDEDDDVEVEASEDEDAGEADGMARTAETAEERERNDAGEGGRRRKRRRRRRGGGRCHLQAGSPAACRASIRSRVTSVWP